jgi:protein gp37
MSENTKIEWCDHTFNPWIGCTQVGPGCDNCYAKSWDRRFAVSGHAMHWGAGQARSRTKTWGDPVKWNKTNFYECSVCGWRGSDKDDEFSRPKKGCIHILAPARQRVFCASLADVFDNEVDPKWRADLFRAD